MNRFLGIIPAPDLEVPLWTVGPFIALLLSIAIVPLVFPHWWHKNRNKAILTVAFGTPSLVIALIYEPHAVGHTALEYLAFVCLLGSLFTISGGVRVAGSLAGTPLANTAVLGLGAILANLVGTTGAAMLLIRPYLRANRRRKSRVHLVVFFIFIVANCGGCLTPLGDPPLFLGFLKGVPFQWTLGLWKPWLAMVGALLVLFNLYDQHRFHREDLESTEDLDEVVERHGPIRLEGTYNLVLLLGVIGIVLASGFWIHPRFGETTALVSQSMVMAALAGLSLKVTPRKLREENEFSWHPFVEVMVLFAGIFAAMIPALAVLRTRGASLGVSSPWQYFWATGSLSSFLDNAPTYLAFLSMAQYLPDEVVGTTHATLSAIACGSVFFGAMTYIGNGPNFMVKAIAEHGGVRMPSFFGYMAWSLAILGPLLVAVTLLFFLKG
jgi:Na+/H+ antiporter NhaD/arsenite permease-like protein